MDDCLEVLEGLLLGGNAMSSPILSCTAEIIKQPWEAAADSGVRRPSHAVLRALHASWTLPSWPWMQACMLTKMP